jgi:hypothetical protein
MKTLILSILLAIIAVSSAGCTLVGHGRHFDLFVSPPPVVIHPGPGPYYYHHYYYYGPPPRYYRHHYDRY